MKNFSLIIFFLVLCFFSLSSRAQDFLFDDFGALPVLHEGRIKPLEHFTTLHIKRWADGQTQPAAALPLMATLLFDPAQGLDIPLVGVSNALLREQLKLPRKQDLFSFNQIESALNPLQDHIAQLIAQPDTKRSVQDESLLRLAQNADEVAQILRSFSMLLPLSIEWPTGFKKPATTTAMTYRAVLAQEAALRDALKTIIKRKGEDPRKYSAQELKIAAASFALDQIRRGGETSALLRVIPQSWDKTQQDWHSPWELIQGGYGGPVQARYLDAYAEMAAAWQAQDPLRWQTTTHAARQMVSAHPDMQALGVRFDLERVYHSLNPYPVLIGLYLFAAAFPLLGCLRRTQNWPWMTIAISTLTLTLALHIGTLGARILILQRPPVGTLYESLLFVSLICAGLALGLGWRTQRLPIMALGAGAAGILLAAAPFLVQGGDSLDTLAAVLNTHFWLTVHVLVITAGYGLCVLAALVAHAVLWRRQPGLESLMHLLSLTALLFTAAGTALGGIWADQSWGRFWGWDPKENGALLIVLWLIWLQHGRIGLKLSARSYAAGTAFLNVVVALSWFGVNLLGVGLHSYGFITGIATALAVFCLAQSGVIFYLWTKRATPL